MTLVLSIVATSCTPCLILCGFFAGYRAFAHKNAFMWLLG